MAGHPGADLRRRAFLLEYLTITWNAFEGLAAIAAGLVAGSVALIAFGLDSSVEVFASVAVVWDLRRSDGRREKRALRAIGVGYFVVAAYIAWDATRSVLAGTRPQSSPLGVILLVATIGVMFGLGIAKIRTGQRLSSPTVTADGRFSIVDGSLAVFVLVGLMATAVLGWWWADGLLALVVAAFALREGVAAWRN